MSSASSAVGTGTVLGLHTAMPPEEARIQDSTLYNPTIEENKSLLKMDFARGQGYFAIAFFALLVKIIDLALSCWCDCTPAKLTRKMEERAWQMEIKELMQRHNQQEVEEGLEVEGWIEVEPKSGSGPKNNSASLDL